MIYRCVVFCWLLITVVDNSWASPMVYRDRSSFLNQSGPVVTNDFEMAFADSDTVSFPGFTARENSIGPNISSRIDYVASGTRALGYTWNGTGYFELAFDKPITAFGAMILDFGTCCGALELWVDEVDQGWRETAAFGPNLPRGNAQYFGVVAAEPFQRVRFTSNAVSDNDLIVFDDLSFHTVPEPSTIGLLTAALLGLIRWPARRMMPLGQPAEKNLPTSLQPWKNVAEGWIGEKGQRAVGE